METPSENPGYAPGTSPPLSDLPVPDLPDQFSFTAELSVIDSNITGIMTYYYDGPGNRGRIEGRFTDWYERPVMQTFILDYNLGEIFNITSDDCTVYAIADDPLILYGTFGISMQNGTTHIGPTFIERLKRNGVPTRYAGESFIRGIRTHHWQACFNHSHHDSELYDYYFVVKAWDYAGQGQTLDTTQMVPAQLTMSYHTQLDDPDGTVVHDCRILSIVDFRAGPDSVPDSLFRIPNGLVCTGRFPGQSIPQVPSFFSTYVQLVSTASPPPSVLTYREFYDFSHKLYKMDIYSDSSQRGAPGPMSIIHDLSTSVQYTISNNFMNCTAQSFEEVAPHSFDITKNDKGTLQLVPPNNFFFLGNEFNYSYEGVSNIRGVDVDSWVSDRDVEKMADAVNYTNVIYEVFFTRPGTVYTTDRSINTVPVPWRLKLSGTACFENVATNVNYEMDFFDFSTDEPPYDAFDISSCSAPEDFYTMILIVPNQERDIDFGQLRRDIRTSVTNYTGLRPLQIGNIQINIVSENGTHIFITFQISNLTSLAKIDPAKKVTAQQAVDLLTRNVPVPFKIQISPNVSVTPTLCVAGRGSNDLCRNNTNLPCQPCNSTNISPNATHCPNTTDYIPISTDSNKIPLITNRLGLSSGTVAGIAIALFILGVIVGILLQLVVGVAIRWCRNNCTSVNFRLPIKYKKQENVTLTESVVE